VVPTREQCAPGVRGAVRCAQTSTNSSIIRRPGWAQCPQSGGIVFRDVANNQRHIGKCSARVGCIAALRCPHTCQVWAPLVPSAAPLLLPTPFHKLPVRCVPAATEPHMRQIHNGPARCVTLEPLPVHCGFTGGVTFGPVCCSRAPEAREIMVMAMAAVGRGGATDVGQRVRDEILSVQSRNNCKVRPWMSLCWATPSGRWLVWCWCSPAHRDGAGPCHWSLLGHRARFSLFCAVVASWTSRTGVAWEERCPPCGCSGSPAPLAAGGELSASHTVKTLILVRIIRLNVLALNY
jgi:hypothetical protein